MILSNFFKNNIYKFRYLYRYEKFRFLFYGFINTVLSNIILQILLVISSVSLATFLSQFSNLLVGFYLYGMKVFNIKKFSSHKLYIYCLLAFISWQLNFILIIFLNEKINISKNLSAILVLPILATWSYLIQKIFIFNKN